MGEGSVIAMKKGYCTVIDEEKEKTHKTGYIMLYNTL